MKKRDLALKLIFYYFSNYEIEDICKELKTKRDGLVKAWQYIGLSITQRQERISKLHVFNNDLSKKKEESKVVDCLKDNKSYEYIAKEFGMSTGRVSRIAKENNLLSDFDYRLHRTEKEWLESINPNFEYIETVKGKTKKDNRYKYRCKRCGKEYEKSYVTMRRGRLRCDSCDKKIKEVDWEALRLKEERKRIQRQQIERNKQIKWIKELYWKLKHESIERAKENAIEKKKDRLNKIRFCKLCGKKYTMNEKGSSEVYCSRLCSAKARSNKRELLLRKNGYYNDKALTLKQLSEKYKDRCAICGELVDWNDYCIDSNGNKQCGNFYPSRDHIIPVSKGGREINKNLQLAHRICNSKKHDKVPPGVKR